MCREVVVQSCTVPSVSAFGQEVGPVLGFIVGPVGETGAPNLQISNLVPSAEGPDPGTSQADAAECAALPSCAT
jgi:hypothetical protein